MNDMNRRRWAFIAVLAAALGLALIPSMGTQADDQDVDHAKEVQQRHTDALLAKPGVLGTGVGLGQNGRAVIRVYTAYPGVSGIPEKLEDVPLAVEVTGIILAQGCPPTTARCDRPVPIGVSTGHPAITAGTIGARVKNATAFYALSNNHIYANSNVASIGDNVLQPGAIDGGVNPADAIGTLSAFEPINFAGGNNTMDAAIALSSTTNLGNATLPGGYGTPSSATVSATIGQGVQKYGRTTLLTSGQVAEINVTVNVCYEVDDDTCTKVARFVDQIGISPGSFSAGGDSGSLIVTNNLNKNPVGLLFAGSQTRTIANRIDLVLTRFGVTIDGLGTGSPPPAVTSVSPSSGSTAGGTAVTITGTGFVGGATVSFGGTAATGVTVVSATSITATTPAHTAGVVDVVVTNPDTQRGTLGGGFTYVAPSSAPTVTSVSPSSGSTAGGTAVTITGTGFVGGATASFGGAAATGVTVVSATSITATTPAHTAGVVDVVVTNPDTQSGTLTGGFTYVTPSSALACAAPTITSASDTRPTGAGTVSFTWNPVNGASQYRVERQKTDGTWSTRQTSSATSFTGSDHQSDPFWRVYVYAGTCTPIPGPATVFDP